MLNSHHSWSFLLQFHVNFGHKVTYSCFLFMLCPYHFIDCDMNYALAFCHFHPIWSPPLLLFVSFVLTFSSLQSNCMPLF